MKSICLVLFMAWGVAARPGEAIHTNINPALLYYQSYLLAPEWTPGERDYLFTTNWQGQKLPEHVGELLARYDQQFRLLDLARYSSVPCDWGLEFSAGPDTLLPHLGRNKSIAQAARLRAMWNLQNGKQAEARNDLLAAFVLGRNNSRDGTLISAEVQIAIENIVCRTVAENFYRLSAATLKELVEGFDAAPARGTVAASVANEQAMYHDWFAVRIMELRRQYPGDETKVMAGIRELFQAFDKSTGRALTNSWNQVIHTPGGDTSEGILEMVSNQNPFYRRLREILELRSTEYEIAIKAFSRSIQTSSNLLVSVTFPVVERARATELSAQVALAMVRAAVAYKLNGKTGLQSVPDPIGEGPFEFKRFEFRGVDRGFQLKSAFAGRGFKEVLIFVESDGPPFNVTGTRAGQAPSD